MANSIIHKIVEEIVANPTISYDTYLGAVEGYSVEIKERVIEILKSPYKELDEKYLAPLYNINRESAILYAFYDEPKEKEKQINELLIKLKALEKYSTYLIKDLNSTDLKPASLDDLKSFYKELINHNIISEETREKTFIDAFSGEDIMYQPKIKFLHPIRIVCFFIYSLIKHNLISRDGYDSIFNRSLIFVNSDNKTYSRFASSYTKYEEYSADDFKKESDRIIAKKIYKVIIDTLL